MSAPQRREPSGAVRQLRISLPQGFSTEGRLTRGFLCLKRRVFVSPSISARKYPLRSHSTKPLSIPSRCCSTVSPSNTSTAGCSLDSNLTDSVSSPLTLTCSTFFSSPVSLFLLNLCVQGFQPREYSQSFTWSVELGLASSTPLTTVTSPS